MAVTKMMFTIKQGNKTVGLSHKEKHYVIGFENVIMARRVQYSMHPEDNITLMRGDGINLSNHLEQIRIQKTSLILDVEATIFVPKYKGSACNPLGDGSFHLGIEKYDEFVTYPFTKSLGIILPHKILHEDDEEFTIQSHVIEPTFNSFLFR